jgi:hypothetical protein
MTGVCLVRVQAKAAALRRAAIHLSDVQLYDARSKLIATQVGFCNRILSDGRRLGNLHAARVIVLLMPGRRQTISCQVAWE